MEPSDRAKVEAIVQEAAAVACPIYPIEPQQRLAYIQDLENLLCTRDDPECGYVAGASYPVDVSTEIDTRMSGFNRNEKVVAGRHQDVYAGIPGRLQGSLKIMAGGWRSPMRYSETKVRIIDYRMLAHFDLNIPRPRATCLPATRRRSNDGVR